MGAMYLNVSGMHHHVYKFLVGFLVLGIVASTIRTFAQTTPVFTIDTVDAEYEEGFYRVIDYIEVFIDSTGDWTIEDVASDEFQPRFAADTLNMATRLFSDFGPDIKFIWVKLVTTTNSERFEPWLVCFYAHEVEAYFEEGDGGFEHRQTGLFIPVTKREFGWSHAPVNSLSLDLYPGDTLRTYYRLKSPHAARQNSMGDHFDGTVFKRDYLYKFDKPFHAWIFFTLGVLLSVAAYHFIIFYYQRDRVTLYFSLFLVAYAMLYAAYKGVGHDVMFPRMHAVHGMSILLFEWMLLHLFHYLFSRDYLKLPALLPVWDKVWLVATIISLSISGVMIGSFLSAGDWSDANRDVFMTAVIFRMIITIIGLLLAVLVASLSWYKGNKVAWIYLVAITPYAFQQIVNNLGYVVKPAFLNWMHGDGGTIMMVLVFAFGIARQIKELQNDKAAADKTVALERASAAKLKELDEFRTRFYTNITHQFRTPLTVILGMADQIKAQPTTWMEKGTEMIKRNSERLLDLVNQVLDLSKLEAGELKVNLVQADIVAFIGQIVETMQSLAAAQGIKMRFQADETSMMCDFDPQKLHDIVSNLLSNAIKFTPASGTIAVGFSITSGAEMWHLEVRDTGRGIPGEALPRVFDRFYQLKTNETGEEGSGVGLALTRELVELMSGTITVDSIPGKGTTFNVALPISHNAEIVTDLRAINQYKAYPAPPVDPDKLSRELFGSKEGERAVVLVVEDNLDVSEYIRSVLIESFDVTAVGNGQLGLDAASRMVPDIIVSDIMMPVMNGIEMCKRLKSDKLTSHIPILLLTAKADTPSRIEGWEAGADAYLTKPFDKRELLIRIQELVDIRTRLQERYSDSNYPLGERLVLFKNTRRSEDAFMSEIHELILAKMPEPSFGVEDICSAIGMSRTQLYKKFKAVTGGSIGDYIRKLRLYKARSLLQTTDLNVTQVAMEVGISNLSSFSRSFSQEFGISPSEARPKLET